MKREIVVIAVLLLPTARGAMAEEADRALPAPFTLTSEQQAAVDQVLRRWEQGAAGVKTFQWSFTRWEYDSVFGPAHEAESIGEGFLEYAPPDQWMYRFKGPPPEHWICDGRSLFIYDYGRKRFIELKLPTSRRNETTAGGPLAFSLLGKAMVEGPLQSLLFVTEPQRLKERYFLRVVTPSGAKDQVWLEAYPRFRGDRALFRIAELILATSDGQPYALQIHDRDGKCRTAYLLRRVRADKKGSADGFRPTRSPDSTTRTGGANRVNWRGPGADPPGIELHKSGPTI
jgi:TIGR03009 family protein